MNTEHESGKDSLQELLVFAGRREEVESHRFERVEAHVFDHWSQLTDKRKRAARRNRTIRIGGFLAIAASLVLAVNLFPNMLGQSPVIATLEGVVGSIQVGYRDQPMTTVHSGSEIRAGSIMESTENSGASLALASGHSLRIAQVTRVRLQRDTITLDKGSVYIDSGSTGAESALVVRTSFGTVHEFGTQYLVSILDDSFVVSVREGAININRDNGPTLTATAGEALYLDRDGSSRREPILNYGGRWQWASELGQPMVLEGRTLAEFFAWLSKENGWEVTFIDDSLRRSAMRVQLHGSIAGLDGEQALRSVAATVGWDFSLTNGVVTVSLSDAHD